jgi:hypothetical protein
MSYTITARDVRRQLKSDLIGKDSHRGITLTYAWMANQFSHYALGFIPTFLLYRYFAVHPDSEAALRFAFSVSAIWLAFEAFNFLGPLFKKHSLARLVYSDSTDNNNFKPAWKNIAFDTFTDLLFFWTGAFSASLACSYSFTSLYVLIALISLLVWPVRYWFHTKMYLQIAQYPFQFRLSQWNNPIGEEQKKIIENFLNSNGKGKHLLIFGSQHSAVTSLAVGIATELSIRHHSCIYTTGMKLCSMFFEPAPGREGFWDWRSAEVLVIDDINPGQPIVEDLVTPEEFLNCLDTHSQNKMNREIIKEANVIWVLGNAPVEKQVAERWGEMLIEIGVEKDKIYSINLLQPSPSNARYPVRYYPKAKYDSQMQM